MIDLRPRPWSRRGPRITEPHQTQSSLRLWFLLTVFALFPLSARTQTQPSDATIQNVAAHNVTVEAVPAPDVPAEVTAAPDVSSDDKPIPVLTGGSGFFSDVKGGQAQIFPVVSPVLLVPIGENLLIESRAKIQDLYLQAPDGSYHRNTVTYFDYLQLDYIVNRYVTVTAGRFLTPFGIYNERLFPFWIRDLQNTPLIFPIGTGSSIGGMLRGGFSLRPAANFNYAVYYSANSTNSVLLARRSTGARLGVFLARPRIEIGGSYEQLLQQDRSHMVGVHFGWQPNRLPLNLRSEFARSGTFGSGYWLEGAYRLSQIPHGRHFELVGRSQQYLAGKLPPAAAARLGFPVEDMKEGDFGVNYYVRDGMKVESSYGRQFAQNNSANIWCTGFSYRFVLPATPWRIR